jgi:hypothetical protein
MIEINQSDDAQKDIECLHRIVSVLKSYPGQDKVSLAVVDNGERTNLEIPDVTVNYCPELARELGNVVGERNFKLAS